MAATDDRLNDEVRQRISSLADEDLLAVLDGPRDYTAFALDVARQELSRRGGRAEVIRRLQEARVAASEAIAEQYESPMLPLGETGLTVCVYDRDDYASYWRRGLADFVDALILAVPLLPINLINETVGGLVAIAAFALYHIGFKGERGTTPGYRVTKIKLVSMDGSEVTLRRVAIRQVSSVLSSLFCGMGFLWIAFDPNKQAWHDKIAGTYVVRSDATPVGMTLVRRGRALRKIALAVLFVILAYGGLVAGSYVYFKHVERHFGESEAYHASKDYLSSHDWILTRVGAPTDFIVTDLDIWWDSRTSTIDVKGPKGQAVSTVRVERRGEKWIVVSALCDDDVNTKIDIVTGQKRLKWAPE